MSDKSPPFDKGDWIVHSYYGVGQIKGIENKKIGEQKNKYYIVEARNSTYFVPIDNAENDRIRPVASKYMLKKAINTLKDPPQDFDNDHNQRKRQLAEMLEDCSVVNTAALIRDLMARRIENGLNDHEENTLTKLTSRLTREWAITQNIEIDQAREKFNDVIEECLQP